MPDPKTDLLSLPPDEFEAALGDHFAARNQPAYRIEQVRKWVFDECVSNVGEMTNLPVAEREALSAAFSFVEPIADTVSRSKDGTVKHLWKLADGELVESVLIPTTDRLTLCISSQAGCAMGCTFCATGWAGFQRQLTSGEIVAQYRASRRWALEHDYGRISNIVYMGMGEPLSNRRALHSSLTILNEGYGVGARRITVSTVGVVPGILELAGRKEQFRLAVSLHAPESELRSQLIPLENRHPLEELMDALVRFDRAGGRRITFEYTMIRGINDAPRLASGLADLASSVDAFVNLIPFNPIPYQDWKASRGERIEEFRSVLEARGISVAVRVPRGRDIDAACGQLRATRVDANAAKGCKNASGPLDDPDMREGLGASANSGEDPTEANLT
ncbi:MAG TPA: 23S rRNA (adenine(2503)-C(2))-methyltransferase RlmN [Gemmatimonadetes bacterium]|nr:23S rRNA (adenine(2503)-C(2))-methyltransferase RlmN [Gemmatimonadota bacterium]